VEQQRYCGSAGSGKTLLSWLCRQHVYQHYKVQTRVTANIITTGHRVPTSSSFTSHHHTYPNVVGCSAHFMVFILCLEGSAMDVEMMRAHCTMQSPDGFFPHPNSCF